MQGVGLEEHHRRDEDESDKVEQACQDRHAQHDDRADGVGIPGQSGGFAGQEEARAHQPKQNEHNQEQDHIDDSKQHGAADRQHNFHQHVAGTGHLFDPQQRQHPSPSRQHSQTLQGHEGHDEIFGEKRYQRTQRHPCDEQEEQPHPTSYQQADVLVGLAEDARPPSQKDRDTEEHRQAGDHRRREPDLPEEVAEALRL